MCHKKTTEKGSCLFEDTERPCAAPRSSGDREGGTPLRGKHGGPANMGTTWEQRGNNVGWKNVVVK